MFIKDLGFKIDHLRAFGDPHRLGHKPSRWAELGSDKQLAYELFEDSETHAQKLDLSNLQPLFSHMRNGRRSVTERQLRLLASSKMFGLEHDFGEQAWRMFVNLLDPDFAAKLMREGYGRFSRPHGNPFVDPAGPLAWLAPFRWSEGGLEVIPVPPLDSAAGGPERFGAPRFGPRQKLPWDWFMQIELPIAKPCFVLLLAVFPPSPDRHAMCLSPYPLAPDLRFDIPAALLPSVATAGLRAFQAPSVLGEYLLIGLLTERPLACPWLNQALASFYVPTVDDLALLRRDLEAHDPAGVEVRYRTMELVPGKA